MNNKSIKDVLVARSYNSPNTFFLYRDDGTEVSIETFNGEFKSSSKVLTIYERRKTDRIINAFNVSQEKK